MLVMGTIGESLSSEQKNRKVDLMRLLRWLVRAAVSILLIVVLLMHTDIHRASQWVGKMSMGWLALAVLIKGIGIGAGIIRWKVLLDGQKLNLRTLDLGGAYLIGRFLGSFLPSTIGLDAYRTYYASVRTRKVAKCFAVTLVEKVIGLFALSSLALLALPFGMRLLPHKALWFIAAVMCVPIAISALMLAWPGLFTSLGHRLRKRERKMSLALARMADVVGEFGRQKRRLAVAVFLGLIVHGATASMYVATARAVGVHIPASEILFIGPLMIAATLVPLSIAGIGVREGTYVFFLAAVGVDAGQAAILGFLGFLAGEIYSLLGGAVWMLKPASRPEADDSLAAVIKRAAAWAKSNPASSTGKLEAQGGVEQ